MSSDKSSPTNRQHSDGDQPTPAESLDSDSSKGLPHAPDVLAVPMEPPPTVVSIDVLSEKKNDSPPESTSPPTDGESWLLELLHTTADAVQLPILYQSVAYVIALLISMIGLCMMLNVVTWNYPNPKTQLQLPDIMLDTLPDIPALEHVTDLILSILVLSCFLIVGAIWAAHTGRRSPASEVVYHRYFPAAGLPPFSSTHPYFVPWIRFFICYTAISLLRIVVIGATILPATDNQCRTRPSTGNFWWNTFMGVVTFGSGSVHCGDLLFSGHAAVITLAVCALWSYGPILHRWVRPAACTAMVASWFTIFASRSHYTDDVIIGTYISLTLWALVPHDASRGSPLFCQLLVQFPWRWIGKKPPLSTSTDSVPLTVEA